MKKLAALLVASLMALSMLSGCYFKVNNTSVEEEQQNGVSLPTEPVIEDIIPGDVGEEAVPDIEFWLSEEKCAEVFDAIDAHQPGTAGGSIKCFSAAATVLNASEGMEEANAETVKGYADNWLAGKDAAAIDDFKLKLEDIDACARLICDGDADTLALEADSETKLRYESYTLEDYELFYGALTAALAELQ